MNILVIVFIYFEIREEIDYFSKELDELNTASYVSNESFLIAYNNSELKESYSLNNIQITDSNSLNWENLIEKREEVLSKEIIKENEIHKLNNDITVLKSLELPSIFDTSFKGYMCIHKLSSVNSKQYNFLNSGEYNISSDNNGFIKYGNYYVVAMGSYYHDNKIGTTFRITLDSGDKFDVIIGDVKSNSHTDIEHKYRDKGGNRGEVIEFIVACGKENEVCTYYNTLSDSNRRMGNLSNLGFKGNIKTIESLNDFSVVNKLYK
jgi:hypothetical protein